MTEEASDDCSADRLLGKLVINRCLPGPERRLLIDLGGINYSGLKRVIITEWRGRTFPPNAGNCSIEKLLDGTFRLYEKYEAGVDKFAHRSKDFNTIDEVVEEFIACEFGTNIDGISIQPA